MLSRIKKSNIETELARYKEISEQIKALKEQQDNLKNSLITSYFSRHDEYKNKAGIVLATYKAQIRAILDTVSLRTEQPKIYAKYCNDKTVFTFLVK